MLDAKYEEIVTESSEDIAPRLPPWKKSTLLEKAFRVVLNLAVYFPVLTLWTVSLFFYLTFIFCYLIPNVSYTSSHAELYYWNTSSEYFLAKVKAWIIFGLLSVFLILFYISTIRAMMTAPGSVPKKWDISGDMKSEIEKRQDGQDRICIRCEMKKPDRTHHCRQCQKCVLRIDHHCNWIANCVGFYNYKYFICMLFNAVICISIVVGSLWETVVIVLNDETNHTSYCFFITFAYSIAFLVFFVLTAFTGYHFWLIWNNLTTIEYCEKKRNNSSAFKGPSPYTQGIYMNFKQALGENPLFWFIPTKFQALGDGTTFAHHGL
ncbi:hypothetical protein SteCoe_17861 [Stentor coeruleus]|uniref:Palmitoyltransferase n=1 Tax=Stentor coeruleus TaxID=5963 RepID=A0A1R2BY23_9CILI|nr:hypothetical protein SteCoe_17861 [Stentor coeruleus]